MCSVEKEAIPSTFKTDIWIFDRQFFQTQRHNRKEIAVSDLDFSKACLNSD